MKNLKIINHMSRVQIIIVENQQKKNSKEKKWINIDWSSSIDFSCCFCGWCDFSSSSSFDKSHWMKLNFVVVVVSIFFGNLLRCFAFCLCVFIHFFFLFSFVKGNLLFTSFYDFLLLLLNCWTLFFPSIFVIWIFFSFQSHKNLEWWWW